MQKLLKTILLGKHSFSSDDIQYRPYLLVTAISLLMIPFAFALLLLHQAHECNSLINSLWLIQCAASITIFAYMKRSGNVRIGSSVILLLIACITILFPISANQCDYSFAWTLFLPIFAYYFKGKELGSLISLAFLILLLLLNQFLASPLSFQGYSNIFLLHLGVILVSLFNENSRAICHEQLQEELKESLKKGLEYREKSIVDDLTNLYNRNYFNEIFEKELKRARRSKSFCAFFILDIDFFKQYNDTYGHYEGDLALQSVAAMLGWKFKRADDTIFRLGGEEFGGIFHGNSKEDIIEFANGVRHSIENLQIEHSRNSVSKFVTASIGVVIMTDDIIDKPSELYKSADRALYNAKNNGRNCVESL